MNKVMIRKEEIHKESYHKYAWSPAYMLAFEEGAEWADRSMIDKVCEWLKENLPYSAKPPYQLIEDLRKAMGE